MAPSEEIWEISVYEKLSPPSIVRVCWVSALANVSSHSILRQLLLLMAHYFALLQENKSTLYFWMIKPSFEASKTCTRNIDRQGTEGTPNMDRRSTLLDDAWWQYLRFSVSLPFDQSMLLTESWWLQSTYFFMFAPRVFFCGFSTPPPHSHFPSTVL